jgi:hypothetical protein
MVSHQRADALLRPGYLYSFSNTQSLLTGRRFARLLDESYRLSNRTMDELLDERVAEVLDGLPLLRRKAKPVEQAANLMGSNVLDAVGWAYRVGLQYVAHIPYLNARPFHFPGTSLWGVVSWVFSFSRTGSRHPILGTVRRVRFRRLQQGS